MPKFVIRRCRMTISHQSLQHFKSSSLGCSKNPADECGECPPVSSASTPKISTADWYHLESFLLH